MTGTENHAITAADLRTRRTRSILLWGFHLLCLVLAVGWLWESSSPGTTATTFLILALLALNALVWLICVIVAVARQRQLRLWMAAAPLGGALVVALVSANVPLHVRWAGSESAFAAAVASPNFGSNANSDGYFSPPEQLGTYEIIGFSRNGDRAQFDDASSFCGTSGFAFLPDGDTSVFGFGELITVVDLGGSWLAFEVPC